MLQAANPDFADIPVGDHSELSIWGVVTRVLQGGQVLDETTTPCGFRTQHFDADRGFFLNGQPRGDAPEAEFARLFFGIWLSPRSSEPALREALLGGQAP